MTDSHPFVISVVSGKSFAPDVHQRIYVTQVAWANRASKQIISALESHDAATLKKHFGADPLEEISPPVASGGLDDDIFTTESLGEALEDVDKKRAADFARQRRTQYMAPRQLAFGRRVMVVKDIMVLQDDNLITLKKKVQLATGIPTYRQHLWYEQDGFVFSPCYNYYVDDRRVHINIWDLRAQSANVSGVPVSTAAYAERGHIRVRNTEFSVILGNICESAPTARWFVTDLNDFFPAREQIANTVRADVYIRELIYYSLVVKYWPAITASVFQIYMTNEPVLHDEYPELSFSTNVISRQLSLESALVMANPRPSPKKWPMDVYIEESDITVVNEYYSYGSVVNLRNLFNSFRLSATSPHMICRIPLGGRMFQLTKKFRGGWVPSQKQRVGVDTLCLMTIVNASETAGAAAAIGEMFIFVEAAGTYHVRTKWREDAHMTIPAVTAMTIEFANKIIAQINALGESVVTRPLIAMSPDNTDIIDVSVVMVIHKKLSLAEFENVRANAMTFKQAGLIIVTSAESGAIMFHMMKGMYDYDDARFDAISNTTNGYEYATSIIARQRWEPIYLRQKSSVIVNRSADLFIKSTGVRDGEISAFIKYMLMLVQMTKFGETRTDEPTGRKVRPIAHLKEADPLLYDLKKLYKQKTQYSQICQRPNQPILVDKPSKRSVKFWNFTRKEPAWYECPKANFPSLYFKTGIHPEGYCIPCCKKSELAEGSKHERIYATCIKDHVHRPTERMATTSSYIVAFTSTLEPGRIAYLPESSLDQLFYQQHCTTSKPVDSECIPPIGYYVYGVRQAVGQLTGVGLIGCIAHALELDIDDFIDQTAARLADRQSAGLWPLVLEGRITTWFKSPADFIGELQRGSHASFDQWNEAFAYIARLYWDVNVIHFATGDSVRINIPPGIKHIDEIVSARHRHLIVIAADGAHLPIYLVNIADYKADGRVAQRLFKSGDKAIAIIRQMIIAITGAIPAEVDLERMIEFADGQDAWKLETALINTRNVCYAIMLRGGRESLIYWPIANSLHDHLELDRDTKEFDRREYHASFDTISGAIAAYNTWATAKDTAAIKITVAIWLLLGDQVIGFQDQDRKYNYYVAPMTRAEAEAARPGLEFVRLMYDPAIINALINAAPKAATEWPAAPPIAQCLYDHYKYQLLIMEFISAMNKMTNEPVRETIYAVIRRDIKTPSILFHNIKTILSEWSADYDHILGIFAKFTGSFGCETSEYSALIGNKRSIYDADTIIRIIKQSRFSFDDIAMAALEKMEPAALGGRLDEILRTIVDVAPGDVKIAEWPAIMTSCSQGQHNDYCADRRLKISAADYATYKEQLARDIKNPLKQRKLVLLVTRATTGELSFTNHPDEHIYVNAE